MIRQSQYKLALETNKIYKNFELKQSSNQKQLKRIVNPN